MSRPCVIIFSLTLLLLSVACSDDGGSGQDAAHQVTSATPLSGKKGTLVTIAGEGFAADSSRMDVYFNGRLAIILSAAENQLVVSVPAGAGPGFITVSKDGQTVGGPYFDFIYTANITTFSGSVQGYTDGSAASARFNRPRGLAIDSQGNLFVADEGNQVIRRVFPNGTVNTFSGSGLTGHADGPPGSARFNEPYDIAFDAVNQDLYVADKGNHCIRKVTYSGDVSTVAGIPQTAGYVDGAATAGRLNNPTGLAWKGELFSLLIADHGNHCIRKLDHQGILSSFAGSGVIGFADGTGSGARFNGPLDIAWDSSGYYYVTDALNHNVRQITPSATVTTIAGSGAAGFVDGPSVLAEFNAPQGVDGFSGMILVCDKLNNRIRIVSGQNVSTLAGSGSPGSANGEGAASQFFSPGGIVRDSFGVYYIADTENHLIRKMVLD